MKNSIPTTKAGLNFLIKPDDSPLSIQDRQACEVLFEHVDLSSLHFNALRHNLSCVAMLVHVPRLDARAKLTEACVDTVNACNNTTVNL